LRGKKKKATIYVPKDFETRLPAEQREDGKAIYDYELWLDRETKRLKARIALIAEKDKVARERHERNGMIPSRATFGTRKQYKLKDTTDIDMDVWHKERDFVRNSIVLFSGRYYFLIKASVTKKFECLNENTENGVVSVDMNLDNISWSELSDNGKYIRGGIIEFDLTGKSSHQIDDILGRACSQVISHCREVNKPLVLEDIDLRKKKSSMAYGNKKANAGTSLFAYSKMSTLLTNKAYRNGIGVLKINPAYTSQIGKVKYMRKLRSTVHQAASYVIGRRGMGFSEKIPAIYKGLIPEQKKRKHHWKQFAHIATLIEGIPADIFRKELPSFISEDQLKAYAEFA
jgi:IS605 OrfB family transposase